ncbi:hypothetical protein Ddye_017647 [Dipteronia dyeriana]|uniref:Uncharacterized protein n=1 Tax=Dipteronia dyeriana TaxID=168575 RepID=A0AAD9U9M5_9ROSI|nr:hypothetical protein Ddye_017647 [Dipteronia dyeriana]
MSGEVEPEKSEKKAINVENGRTFVYKNDDLRNGSQTNISVNLPTNSQEVASQKFST